ncbi:ATP-binding protein [Weissella tructae]|uniref:DNA repair ATPase n=2 Tax=Weissella TaxID=46255 RepID=A0A075U6H0_9LACO|nr:MULTISPECIES: AAA family ATPase [Weissella]AIG65742.1 DNA repair ATPase [Weissella tructae]AIM63121.1 DNA repair ATPase [Weissella ceti]AIM64457.1 DNA repair ATPase [Weissella ceti]ELA06805.1 hypothetical protein WCNC_04477 [Weissella ceti NC36]QVV90907.1 AAA family ATPase [Weissella tructae]
MKITKIHIDHFGCWQNQQFEFTDGLQIVSGLNGTGKTTLHAYIQGMLFGFPSAKSATTTYENQSATAIYGGRLWFTHNGVCYELARHQRTNSTVILKNAVTNQEFANPEDMLSQMMAPLTPALYQSIYQFNQDDLLEILTLKPTELLERLRVIGIPNAQGWLRQSDEWVKEAESSLGKTVTAKRPINQKIAQLEEAKATLHRMEQGLPQLEEVEQQITSLKSDVQTLQSQQTQQVVADQYQKLQEQLQEVDSWLAAQPPKLRESDVTDIQVMQNTLASQYTSDDVSRWYDIERLLAQLSAQPVATRQQTTNRSELPWMYMVLVFVGGVLLGSLLGKPMIGVLLGIVIAGALFLPNKSAVETTTTVSTPRDARLIEQLEQLGFMVNDATNIAVSRQQVAQEIGKLTHQNESYRQVEQQLAARYHELGISSDADFDVRREQLAEISRQEQRQQILRTQLADVTEQEGIMHSVDDLADVLQQKHAQIAQLEVQLDRLGSDQSLRQQRQMVENWESELINDMRDYFALQMAAQWTRQSFDAANNDRWPRLEQQADRYLQTLTKGQYQHVTWTEKNFEITDYQNQTWDVRRLSRGTAQQLYVALRLAMISELQAQVNMPLLIDDAFVDFDVERQSALLSLLRTQSSEQQIFYFTKDAMTEPDQVIL